MRIGNKIIGFIAAVGVAITLSSCKETAVQPTVGDGSQLQAPVAAAPQEPVPEIAAMAQDPSPEVKEAEKGDSADAAQPQGEEEAKKPVPPPKGDDVVITIGDRQVTFDEYLLYSKNIDKRPMALRGVALATAERIINENLMRKEAASIPGFDKRPGLMSKIYARTGSIWRDAYWNKVVLPRLQYTREDVLAFMPTPNHTVTIRQFVSSDKAKAESIRQRALAGEDYVSLITRNSEGLTAANGGLVENIAATEPRFTTNFIKVLFNTPEGAFSEVVYLPIGYTFFRVEEIRTVQKWQDILYAQYEKQYRDKRAKEIWDEELTSLVDDLVIVRNDETITEYSKLSEAGDPVVPIFDKVLFSVNGNDVLVCDVIDPTGTGLIHGSTAVDSLVNSFIENIAVRDAVRKKKLADPDLESLEEFLVNFFYAREYINYRNENLKVTEEEVREAYEKSKDSEFTVPARSRFAVIETKNEGRVKKIYELLDAGKPFDEVALEWSDHKSKRVGGDIGWAEAKALSPEYRHIIDLEDGQYLREPLRLGRKPDGTPLVYLIVKKTESKEGGVRPLDAALTEKIAGRLITQKRANINAVINNELIEKYKDQVKIEEDSLIAYSDSLGDEPNDENKSSAPPAAHGMGGMGKGGPRADPSEEL